MCYLCSMKRQMIWVLTAIIVLLSAVLLYMQWRNAELMVKMRKEQFDESVLRSLDQASHDLERDETFRYLEAIVRNHEEELHSAAHQTEPLSLHKPNSSDTLIIFQPQRLPLSGQLPMIGLRPRTSSPPLSLSFLEAVQSAYTYQRSVLDEVIYTILYNASEDDLSHRLNTGMLDSYLSDALKRNGVNIPFHFRVETAEGVEVFRCSEYDSTGSGNSYTQTLFRNDPVAKMGVVKVHFPTMGQYIWGVARTMTPMMGFTFLLLLIFCFTVWQLARQKKVSEMKNDFINNMTHEFKTPLASISLAAQMLSDKSVTKTEKMYENLAGIITNESRRLRFQVEKVLQMSLFDHDNIRLKTEELDANAMLESVINTFQLRIKQSGGQVETRIEAYNPFIYGDEMHLTNVFFNLMDNAVKYAKPDEGLHLLIHTANVGDNFQLSIQDNGIGIQKGDLSHIFERFYRVHTGNQHNVKGFGLGLAYVHTIIGLHHGKIKVESEYGQGTCFIITLPNVRDEE